MIEYDKVSVKMFRIVTVAFVLVTASVSVVNAQTGEELGRQQGWLWPVVFWAVVIGGCVAWYRSRRRQHRHNVEDRWREIREEARGVGDKAFPDED